MKIEGYSLYLGRVFGQPVRFHASLALGLLFVTGMRFAPGAWLGVIALVLVHELGHGLLVRLRGGRVTSVTLYALGGECAFVGASSPLDRAIIAWGGVLAQAVALFVAYLVLALVSLPSSPLLSDLFGVLIEWNAIVIVINLLPVPPLDGATAWTLVPMLRAGARAMSRPKPGPKRR